MGEMEDTEFDDVLDDWFIESLKTYKDLHVYQLEHPTQVLEWTSGKTVCVAGYSSSKNEILELCLPMKILADENKGLCAERDFKVSHGGFTDGPVRCLTHIPGTRCAVTNDGLSSDLQVWDLGGDESDVIRRTGSMTGKRSASERGSRIAARPSSTPQVLHGDQVNDIQLTELTSGQTLYKLGGASSNLEFFTIVKLGDNPDPEILLYPGTQFMSGVEVKPCKEMDSADPLSSLQFVSDAVFLAGCCNGNVYVADTRMSAAPQLSPSPSSNKSVTWGTDGSAHPHLSSCRVIRVSSSGLAVVSDLRNLGGAESRAQLDIQTPGCCSQVDVKVSWAPALDDCISVSGFSGVVQIYNSRVWRAELQEAQPLFEHRGHVVSSQQTEGSVPAFVTSHVWHPERPRTLLSAASDGSVHVWDWVDPDRLGGSPPPEAK